MKIADIIGFTAAVGAGTYGGYQYSQNGTLNFYPDWVVILVLLAVAFYFAVVLS